MCCRGAQQHPSRLRRTKRIPTTFLYLLWDLIMDIPIKYPWYRWPFPKYSDFSGAEPLTDWPAWSSPWSLPWSRPSFWRWFNWFDSGYGEMHVEKDRYVVYLDVKHFSPDELSVCVNEEFITIHAKHEDRKDEHGFVSREFLRKYRIPAGLSGSDVTAHLSVDGVLTVTTPRSPPGPERTINIACEDGTNKQK